MLGMTIRVTIREENFLLFLCKAENRKTGILIKLTDLTFCLQSPKNEPFSKSHAKWQNTERDYFLLRMSGEG